jgi:hypothetical protein
MIAVEYITGGTPDLLLTEPRSLASAFRLIGNNL